MIKTLFVAFAWLLFAVAAQTTAEENTQPPQLLGVWYGQYTTSIDGQPTAAEMWMLVSWQLSKDGWSIRGHNRWNVLNEDGETAQGAAALGRNAEHFDTFSGQIAKDRKQVVLTEQTRGSRIEAHWQTDGVPDAVSAQFFDKGSASPAFTVELSRLDTHYTPGEITGLGIDVSHHSGAVDWNKIKQQSYTFAYIKASEGVDNPDAMFATNFAGAREAGLAYGAYHFYVTEDDPHAQASLFAKQLAQDVGTLPPAVDVEVLGANTHGDMTDTLLTFLLALEAEVGVKPVIYTTSRFWDEHYRPEFSDYPLWMAEYGVKMPKVPFGWDNWLLWQHAADRTVPGVEKNADISLLHPNVKLESLLISAPQQTPKKETP